MSLPSPENTPEVPPLMPDQNMQYSASAGNGYQPARAEKPQPNKTVRITLILLYAYIALLGIVAVVRTSVGISTKILLEPYRMGYSSRSSSIESTIIMGMVVGIFIGVILYVGLGLLFTLMYRAGYNWARITIIVLAIILAVLAVFNLTTTIYYMMQTVEKADDSYILFRTANSPVGVIDLVNGSLSLILTVSITIFMFHKDSREYTRACAAWRIHKNSQRY